MTTANEPETYFHIQRLDGQVPEWKVGFESTTDNINENFYYQDVLRGSKRESANFIHQIGGFDAVHCQLQAYPKAARSEDKTEDDVRTLALSYGKTAWNLLTAHRALNQSLREEIFENIRVALFPRMPSRKKGIWLCKATGVDVWWPAMAKTAKEFELKVLRVEIDEAGKCHLADEKYVRDETFDIESVQQNAMSYWKGTTDENSIVEFLYEGPFKVVDSLTREQWKATSA